MSRVFRGLLCLLVGACLLGSATAQVDVCEQVIPHFSVSHLNAQDALTLLFKEVGLGVTFEPEVRGKITLSSENTTFEKLLRLLLNEVDCTYRVEGGIFQIIKREGHVPCFGEMASAPKTIKPVPRKRSTVKMGPL